MKPSNQHNRAPHVAEEDGILGARGPLCTLVATSPLPGVTWPSIVDLRGCLKGGGTPDALARRDPQRAFCGVHENGGRVVNFFAS